jgi:Relaxase/Mobilisation nuclease domain
VIRVVRVGRDGDPFLEIFSHGRGGPQRRDRFTSGQIAQITRTVRRTPEVMVKVTGGGRSTAAVGAHFSYISAKGKIEIETDEGQRIDNEGQKELLKGWHLELTPGQYREGPDERHPPRRVKLVHNIVLSMPRPTPPDKVLAAARTFAREHFGAKHQYAMALHTHQDHPHVHLVVKAEGRDGQRLHIDKAMLREWREHFAELIRAQGVPANATPRVVRGRGKSRLKETSYQAIRRGRSDRLRARLHDVARELKSTKTIRDPVRGKLLETRKAVIAGWMGVAAALEAQGEIVLGGDVRYFANHLPPVLTDRERLAAELIRFAKAQRSAPTRGDDILCDRTIERTR